MATELDALGLPPFPDLDDELVASCTTAEESLNAALRDVDPLTRVCFGHIQRRLIVEAIAGLDAIAPWAPGLLVPPKWRALNFRNAARIVAAERSVYHLGVRTEMRARGAQLPAVGHETPFVLHAFVEGGKPDARETDAGVLRLTPSQFNVAESTFIPPDHEHCGPLLHAMIERAARCDEHWVAAAGWFLASYFAVHPFVDGNGRTGRLMLHAILSGGSSSGVDWGTQPEIAADRGAYLAAARAVTDPSIPNYDARLLNPLPLMEFVASSNARGLATAQRRLHAIAGAVAEIEVLGVDKVAAGVLANVAGDRNVTLKEVEAMLVNDAPDATRQATELVNGLVRDDLLRWDGYGRLQFNRPNPFTRGPE